MSQQRLAFGAEPIPVTGHPELALVPLSYEEGPKLYEFYQSNPSIDQHMPGHRLLTEAQLIDKAHEYTDRMSVGEFMVYWLTRQSPEDAAASDKVGVFSVYHIQPPIACVSAIIADAEQGHGLAPATVKTLGAHLRDNHGLDKFRLEIEDTNVQSRAAATKLGATETEWGRNYKTGDETRLVRHWELDLHEL